MVSFSISRRFGHRDAPRRDKSNSIDENEFMALLSTVNNGAPLFPGNMGTALMNFDSNDDGLIDFQEFKVRSRRPVV